MRPIDGEESWETGDRAIKTHAMRSRRRHAIDNPQKSKSIHRLVAVCVCRAMRLCRDFLHPLCTGSVLLLHGLELLVPLHPATLALQHPRSSCKYPLLCRGNPSDELLHPLQIYLRRSSQDGRDHGTQMSTLACIRAGSIPRHVSLTFRSLHIHT